MAMRVDWTKFTAKQRKAITGYIRHGCKTKAYTDAYNYTNKTSQTTYAAAHRLFERPNIKLVIEQVHKEAIKRSNIKIEELVQSSVDDLVEKAKDDEAILIDAFWVLKRAALIANFNIRKFIVTDDSGNAIYDFSEADDDDWYCIQEYSVEEINRGQGDNRFSVDKLKLKAFDKLRALELVGKHIQVQAFSENSKVEHSGEVVHKSLSDFYSSDDCKT